MKLKPASVLLLEDQLEIPAFWPGGVGVEEEEVLLVHLCETLQKTHVLTESLSKVHVEQETLAKAHRLTERLEVQSCP